MRYETEIDGRALAVEIETSGTKLSVRVNDRCYDAEVLQPERGVFLIMIGSEVFETRAWPASPNEMRVQIRDRLFPVRIVDRKHRRPSSDHRAEGRQDLTTPMPGKVVRVLLAAGDEVSAGQGVVVVEAMKMQNEIKSPKSGRVTEIRVTAGATVNANQVLAVVE